MKQKMMIIAMSLLVISCGKSVKDGEETTNEQPTTEVKGKTEKSNADRKSDEYIISRVQSIYDDVFADYNKAAEDESIPQNSPDEKYCSDDWNKALLQVAEYDQQNNPDEIGFFDGDYWVMGQDFSDLSISDIQVVKKEGTKAKVELNLHNMGHVAPIRIDLSYERGDWFIDDFFEVEHDFDWKKEMRDYIK